MSFLDKSISIILPRAFVIALLATFYMLAFIITPYWYLTPSTRACLIALFFTIGSGTVWAISSGSSLRVRFGVFSSVLFILLLMILVVLNYKQLIIGIPWRGDEDFHISKTLLLTRLVSNRWAYDSLLGIVIFLVVAWEKPKNAIFFGVALVIGNVLHIILKKPFNGTYPYDFLRYPFVSYWFFAVLPKVASFFTHPYYEAIYRVIPLLFATAIAWVFQTSLTSKPTFTSLLWGISVATIPLVFYYSSILYLELTVVFLMVFVSFRIKSLLYERFNQLRRNPGWYALILIGFIKETAIPFLFCFLAVRWSARILVSIRSHQKDPDCLNVRRKKIGINVRYLLEEVGVAFSVLFPLFAYLFFRSQFSDTRSFAPQLGGLFEPMVYNAIGRSLISQFGLFLVLFFFGCILLFRKKEYAVTIFLILSFIFVLIFHTLDNWIYVGYSRFNLFLLPSVLTGSKEFLSWVIGRRKTFSMVIAGLLILVNLAISPVNIDGTKKPYWDYYNSDTSEHYYPYREAIYWLKKNYPDQDVLFAGMSYPYYLSFYYERYNLTSRGSMLQNRNFRNDTDALADLLAQAEIRDEKLVVYQVRGNDVPELKNTESFRQEKIFKNDAHLLVVYQKIDP